MPKTIDPSAIIFGTMRMLEHNKHEDEWVSLLIKLYDKGMRRIHSSLEYESFPFFCSVLNKISSTRSDINFEHIVKLACPDFNELAFDLDSLENKINAYCAALNVKHIETVQWMWRATLSDDRLRTNNFVQNNYKLAEAVNAVKNAGLIKLFYCFPYTPEFATAAIDYSFIDGLIVYRNPLEEEYNAVIDDCGRKEIDVLTIRPLAAGKSLNSSDVNSLIAFSFYPQAVKGIIISLSKEAQFDEILKTKIQ